MGKVREKLINHYILPIPVRNLIIFKKELSQKYFEGYTCPYIPHLNRTFATFNEYGGTNEVKRR